VGELTGATDKERLDSLGDSVGRRNSRRGVRGGGAAGVKSGSEDSTSLSPSGDMCGGFSDKDGFEYNCVESILQ
jgi:hypothetical protein